MVVSVTPRTGPAGADELAAPGAAGPQILPRSPKTPDAAAAEGVLLPEDADAEGLTGFGDECPQALNVISRVAAEATTAMRDARWVTFAVTRVTSSTRAAARR
jgi:hypothetical protein